MLQPVALLADDKVQYFLVRVPLGESAAKVHRDVFIAWTGPNVSTIDKVMDCDLHLNPYSQ